MTAGRVPQLEAALGHTLTRLEALEQRVAAIEGLLTPEQYAQLRLIKQAEHVVDVAKAEGQL